MLMVRPPKPVKQLLEFFFAELHVCSGHLAWLLPNISLPFKTKKPFSYLTNNSSASFFIALFHFCLVSNKKGKRKLRWRKFCSKSSSLLAKSRLPLFEFITGKKRNRGKAGAIATAAVAAFAAVAGGAGDYYGRLELEWAENLATERNYLTSNPRLGLGGGLGLRKHLQDYFR